MDGSSQKTTGPFRNSIFVNDPSNDPYHAQDFQTTPATELEAQHCHIQSDTNS